LTVVPLHSGLRDKGLSALVYAALFVCLLNPYADFDWGWHYRYGEYLLTHRRILRHDIFSWTMPGYEWVNHSWLYDPLLYVLFNRFSFLGLSVAGGVVGLLIFHLCIRRARLAYWQTAILAVFFATLSQEALQQGLRTQVVGLLPLAVLVDLLFRERHGQPRLAWALPFLFCIWTNLHGSFLLGLIVFGAHVAGDLIVLELRGTRLPRRWFVGAASFLASAALTLVNPFTYHVYREALRHFGNPLLPTVIEWSPPDFSELVGTVFLGYALLLAYGFVTRRSWADLSWLVIAAGTFYLAVTSRRHGPVFLVATLPLAAAVVQDVRLRIEGLARTTFVFAVMIAIFSVAVFEKRSAFTDLWRSSMRTYGLRGPHCSEGLIEYLLRQPPVGRGFNFYDWGGYLIGRGVPTKLFIDGRMHLWEQGDFRPMELYRAIYRQLDLELFDRYQFDWVLVPPNSKLARTLATSRSPSTGLPESRLWETAYRDDTALYIVRSSFPLPVSPSSTRGR
jgi:hypothetical protein